MQWYWAGWRQLQAGGHDLSGGESYPSPYGEMFHFRRRDVMGTINYVLPDGYQLLDSLLVFAIKKCKFSHENAKFSNLLLTNPNFQILFNKTPKYWFFFSNLIPKFKTFVNIDIGATSVTELINFQSWSYQPGGSNYPCENQTATSQLYKILPIWCCSFKGPIA